MANDPYTLPELNVDLGGWRDRAACVGLPMEWFHPMDQEGEMRFLKRVPSKGRVVSCPTSCPVMPQCALDAIINQDKFTVRAGVYIPGLGLASQNAARRRLRKIAAPLVGDEMQKLLNKRTLSAADVRRGNRMVNRLV